MVDTKYNLIVESETKATKSGPTGYIKKGHRFKPKITISSLQFVEENIDKIGRPLAVTACECNIRIIGTKGTLVPEGFCTGYHGEGPSGLTDIILNKLKWDDKEKVIGEITHKITEEEYGCKVLYNPDIFGSHDKTHKRYNR